MRGRSTSTLILKSEDVRSRVVGSDYLRIGAYGEAHPTEQLGDEQLCRRFTVQSHSVLECLRLTFELAIKGSPLKIIRDVNCISRPPWGTSDAEEMPPVTHRPVEKRAMVNSSSGSLGLDHKATELHRQSCPTIWRASKTGMRRPTRFEPGLGHLSTDDIPYHVR